ncbi:MAG: flavodoxin family protein [Tagaea sp.]|nr:flavodoxin family protein [Azospirillum sp.]MCA3266458.1 flavodoxin family protein [Azospirillum sp.]MCZ8124810.1 flavodoxin family protein [Magnetospirillum sp.]
MAKVAIVYHSGFGHTKVMAESVAKGAASVAGTQVDLVPVAEAEAKLETLNAADAIIFGSPTYMGDVSGPFKTWADTTAKIWFGQGWKDKLAAGFTNSASPSGDKVNTLQSMWTLAMQHSMIWVSQGIMGGTKQGDLTLNRLGSYAGAMATSLNEAPGPANPTPDDQATAEVFGRRVAEIAKKFKG